MVRGARRGACCGKMVRGRPPRRAERLVQRPVDEAEDGGLLLLGMHRGDLGVEQRAVQPLE